VFVSERGAPFSTAGFARMLERAAETARLEIKGASTHLDALVAEVTLQRPGIDAVVGQLEAAGMAQHTVRYTELAPTRFKGFWRD
jgi:hypothetical protein